MERKRVVIATDGSCKGNPGPGGWCAIAIYNGTEKEFSGGIPETTNCRAELIAVIEGISKLNQPCDVEIQSDSTYVVDGINNAKVNFERGWTTKDKAPMANVDLWQALTEKKVAGKHHIHAVWMKGHAGNDLNERCNRIAQAEAKKCLFQLLGVN